MSASRRIDQLGRSPPHRCLALPARSVGSIGPVVLSIAITWLQPAKAAELTLVFPTLKAGGQVSVAVFKTGADWKARARPAWTGSRPVQGEQLRLELNLPPGAYGVMAYQDRNSNGRLDTLPIGVPTEPYGFSNNARGTFGPPAWSAARFTLPPQGAIQSVRLR